jgi:Ubiquinone biosynthesis protein COQ7
MEETLESNIKKLKGNFLERAIRVNHAGEYGAICIYSGQKFILKKSSIIDKIIEMEEQEKEHFHYFNERIKEQRVRPTVLLPIWRALGGVILVWNDRRRYCDDNK